MRTAVIEREPIDHDRWSGMWHAVCSHFEYATYDLRELIEECKRRSGATDILLVFQDSEKLYRTVDFFRQGDEYVRAPGVDVLIRGCGFQDEVAVLEALMERMEDSRVGAVMFHNVL